MGILETRALIKMHTCTHSHTPTLTHKLSHSYTHTHTHTHTRQQSSLCPPCSYHNRKTNQMTHEQGSHGWEEGNRSKRKQRKHADLRIHYHKKTKINITLI